MMSPKSRPHTQGLRLEHVTVKYGGETAVQDVSLSVERGKIIALLGPSGCGKSTLLRAIAGLETLTAGSVWWDEQQVTHQPSHERNFGLMFQDGQLFTHLTVAQNIAYGLKMRRTPRHEQQRRITDLLHLVNLEGFEHRTVTQLSGGQRQRVALARSLAPEPKLLMLDEPLSALDATLRTRLAIEIRDLLRRLETTTILVTHDEREAATIADRTYRMADGKLLT